MGSKEEEVEEERKIHHPLEFLIFSGLNVYPSEPPNLNLAVGPSPPRWLQPFTMPLGRPPNSTEQVIVSCLSAELGWGYSHPSWNPVNPHAFSHWRVWHHVVWEDTIPDRGMKILEKRLRPTTAESKLADEYLMKPNEQCSTEKQTLS